MAVCQRDVRKANIAAFNDDQRCASWLQTMPLAEGVNLQRGAHLMVNYDLSVEPEQTRASASDASIALAKRKCVISGTSFLPTRGKARSTLAS